MNEMKVSATPCIPRYLRSEMPVRTLFMQLFRLRAVSDAVTFRSNEQAS